MRTHYSLLTHQCKSILLVAVKRTSLPHVICQYSCFSRYRSFLKTILSKFFFFFFKTTNPILHSLQLLPSSAVRQINQSTADIIHLHWTQHEMLAVEDLPRIKKTVVWTLHDMWAFCGAEHLAADQRWITGYSHSNMPSFERGLNLNYFTWARKRNSWKTPVHLICPSNWMMQCVKKSALLSSWPCTVIPNAIDTTFWDSALVDQPRQSLGLLSHAYYILFCVSGSCMQTHKGFDLLLEALSSPLISNLDQPVYLLLLGDISPGYISQIPIPSIHLGSVDDDSLLRQVYSAVDLTVIPSRIDNLPNAALESMSCSVPIVSFNVCGLPDLVRHRHTGYLAKPFDTHDFAAGISWLLSDTPSRLCASSESRLMAVERFSYPSVAKQHIALYQDVLNRPFPFPAIADH